MNMETNPSGDATSFINGATPGTQLPFSTGINQPNVIRVKEEHNKNDEPRPIKAAEIRSFLYVWCTQKKVKPEYDVESKGTQPNLYFECKLSVSGVDYVSVVQAPGKKAAQTKAAWDFAEHLVKIGEIKAADLPLKKVETKPVGTDTQMMPQPEEESPEVIERNGGWSVKNTRQRLNQIVGRLSHHRTNTPDFVYEMEGEVHSKPLFVCTLTLNIKAFNRDSFFQTQEFTAVGKARNKKAATAECSLLMVRQLYAANFVEKFGETPFKIEAGSYNSGDDDQNRKRKADAPPAGNDVNENGNWTPELARSRLNQYAQAVRVPCEIVVNEKPSEQPGVSMTYTADLTMSVPINGMLQTFSATSTANSKKFATAAVSFDVLVQLYRLGQIEVYDDNAPKRPKQPREQRERYRERHSAVPPSFMDRWHPMYYHMPPVKETRVEDKYLTKKHRAIFPGNKRLQLLQSAVCATEQAMKTISGELSKTQAETPAETGGAGDAPMAEKPSYQKKHERTLQACFRVGNLAKGLLLNDELEVDLVAICADPPTYQLLYQISQLLTTHIKVSSESDKVSVTPHITDSAIHVVYLSTAAEEGNDLTIYIRITLTSPKLRPQIADDGSRIETPSCSLNIQKCVQALAEVRRAKWFQACMESIPFSSMVIRIFREMVSRMEEWKPLSDWALQLLVEKALKTTPVPLSLGGSFSRVLESLASGIILPGSNGLLDPCEREKVDAIGNFTVQQREALTASAQKCVRNYCFRQLYVTLDLEPFPTRADYILKRAENLKQEKIELPPDAREVVMAKEKAMAEAAAQL